MAKDLDSLTEIQLRRQQLDNLKVRVDAYMKRADVLSERGDVRAIGPCRDFVDDSRWGLADMLDELRELAWWLEDLEKARCRRTTTDGTDVMDGTDQRDPSVKSVASV